MSAYTNGTVWNAGPMRIHVNYSMSIQIDKIRYFRTKFKVFNISNTQLRSSVYSGVGHTWYKDWDYPFYHQGTMVIDIQDGDRVVLHTNYDLQSGDWDTTYPVKCDIDVVQM